MPASPPKIALSPLSTRACDNVPEIKMITTTQDRVAALRRALMRVKPEYFSWPVEQQESYRAVMPEEDWFRIRQTVLQALFQIDVKVPADMDAVLDDFNDGQKTEMTETLHPLVGIGDDYFCLNESLGEKTMLDFTTLHDYDYWDHCFQEEARKAELPEYVPTEYRGELYLDWARLFIDTKFYYATLSMAAGHILCGMEESGEEHLEKLIPYRYVDGKQQGKWQGHGTIFDKVVDAQGMEGQLKELRDRFYQYLADRYLTLQKEFDGKAEKSVYMIDTSSSEENNMLIVFTDKEALKNTRIRHFVHDCRSIAAEASGLVAAVEREQRAVIDFLDRAYKDVLQTYDPSVIKFRKKRRVVVADGVLNDLLNS